MYGLGGSWQPSWLLLVKGYMDKFVYREFIEMELMNTIRMHDLEEENVIFQHDTNLKHTFEYIKDWSLPQKFQLCCHPPEPR